MPVGADDLFTSTAALDSDDISLSDRPFSRVDDEVPAIWVFAKRFDVPRELSPETIAFFAGALRERWEGNASILEQLDVDGLRLALWWESEWWRHNSMEHDRWEAAHPRQAAFATAVLHAIRARIFREEQRKLDPESRPIIARAPLPQPPAAQWGPSSSGLLRSLRKSSTLA